MTSLTWPAKIIAPLSGIGIIIILVLLMNRSYPYVGHDFSYFVPRLIDTNIHIRLHGFSIQWYTPSFGGGLPAFPNPQNLEYSLVQVTSFLLGPWWAILLTTALISFLGYHYFYRFLGEILGLDWMSSTLGAMFFLGNGFYIEHMMVGHLGYQLFPISSVILYALLEKKKGVLSSTLMIALLLAAMIHQAGFYLIVILALSFAVTLPLLYLYRPQILDVRRILLTSILSVLLSTVLGGSKLYAVFAFMRHFPREMVDSYKIGVVQGLLGTIAQLLGVMMTAPILAVTGQNPNILAKALIYFTDARYGIWEIDTGLSPVLIIFLLMGFSRFIAGLRKRGKSYLRSDRVMAISFLTISVWVVLELTLARGLIYRAAKDLPILSSLHVNVRFASALILPLTILGVLQLSHSLFNNGYRRFLVLSFLTLASLLSYFLLSSEIHVRNFEISSNQEIQNRGDVHIVRIADVDDSQVFAEHASSYRPYEPLFGYLLENFNSGIHPGSVHDIKNGHFNMTNPASLVFPEINGTYPFETISVTERNKLEEFIEYGQPDWRIPLLQEILNVTSVVTLVLCMCMLCWFFVKGMLKKK